jgi:hypothetical protein
MLSGEWLESLYATQVQLFMSKRLVFILLIVAAGCGAVSALFHFGGLRWQRVADSSTDLGNLTNAAKTTTWADAMEKVKGDRGALNGGAIEIPPELKHYSDRHWFLATQVAEVAKYNVESCQDYAELAAMIERGEMVMVPEVTDTYVLYGVGARADDSDFTEFVNEDDKTGDEKVNEQAAAKARAASHERFLRDYPSLEKLAKDFAGRSYDLSNPSDRQALKLNMLRSIRPQALKVLEEVALAYNKKFDWPLPISSLVRPEQYQRSLRRVNRNAVLIDTPPHSTGLAFDIDYRYMSGTEQTFVMAELARMKREGRIEVIRERNANYHVFAFLNGARPSDDLITASLEKAGAPDETETNHAAAKPEKTKAKSSKTKPRSKPAKAGATSRKKRR